MQHKTLASITLISGLIFIATAFYSTARQEPLLDLAVIAWLSQNISPTTAPVFELVSLVGSGEVILLMTLALAAALVVARQLHTGALLLFATFGGIALNYLLKLAFQRERPGEMSYIEIFGYSLELASYSFPSGHTMRSVIFFAFLMYVCRLYVANPTLRVFGYAAGSAMIVAIGLGRVVTGAHFPTDVAAAASIAIAWFCISIYATSGLFGSVSGRGVTPARG